VTNEVDCEEVQSVHVLRTAHGSHKHEGDEAIQEIQALICLHGTRKFDHFGAE